MPAFCAAEIEINIFPPPLRLALNRIPKNFCKTRIIALPTTPSIHQKTPIRSGAL
jgi:hypothetical protein